MSAVLTKPSLCERLLNEQLDVDSEGNLDPSDGQVMVLVEQYKDIEEFVRGSVLGVHWLARLTRNELRREGGWECEYRVQRLEDE